MTTFKLNRKFSDGLSNAYYVDLILLSSNISSVLRQCYFTNTLAIHKTIQELVSLQALPKYIRLQMAELQV